MRLKVLAISTKHKSIKTKIGDQEVWYHCGFDVNKLEKGKEYDFYEATNGQGQKILYFSEQKQQHKQHNQNRDRTITRLALLNTATKIIEITLQARSFEPANNTKTITSEIIKKSIKKIAEDLEKWVMR